MEQNGFSAAELSLLARDMPLSLMNQDYNFFFFFPSRELSFPVHLYSDTSLFLLRFSGNASSSFVLSLLLLTKIIVNVNLFGFDRTSKHFVQ